MNVAHSLVITEDPTRSVSKSVTIDRAAGDGFYKGGRGLRRGSQYSSYGIYMI